MHLRRLLLILANCMALVNGAKVRFTNVKCDLLDPTYGSFEKCELKLLQRGIVGMNVHITHKRIITSASVNLSLFKKANGYRPFLYNHTVDYCQFQKNRKRYPFVKIFFDALLDYSNLNHTCPIEDDIIVHNWVLKEEMFKLLPLPDGEYLFKLKLGISNDEWKGVVSGYMSTKE